MESLECVYNEKEREWSGVKQPLLYDFNCSVGNIIYNNLINFPNHICQVSDIDGREVTNRELLSWSIRLAVHFKKMGLKHEDIVGVVAKNSFYSTPVAVGCFMNCTPLHAVNTLLDTDTICQIFMNTSPKVIFCDGDVYEKVLKATRHLKPLLYTLTNHIDGVAKIEDLLQPTPNENLYKPEALALGGDQTVAILCSSGTTGLPKSVCISNYLLKLQLRLVTSEDVIFTNVGLDWVSGLCMTYLTAAYSCKRVFTNKPFTPEYLVELVNKYKITLVFTAPSHAAALVACPAATTETLSSVRSILVGGGCVSLPILNKMRALIKNGAVYFCYGLTEAGFISINSDHKYPSSVGKLLSGVRARIVDDDGKNLSKNEIGEVYLNIGYAWNGYYGNPIETKRMQDSEGWFHTGDLGYFDNDNMLYIVDRKKDIIKYQGMHYWPAEIEQVIQELPEVENVCVVGVYNERSGDEAGAVIVLRKGAELTAQQVKDHVWKRLPVDFKQLHAGVIFIDRLPQNNNGKTLRKEVKSLFEVKSI